MHPSLRWKIPGALCFMAGGLQYLLAEYLSSRTWQNPPYSYARNYISDLGIASCGITPDGRDICSPWHLVMNTGFALEGLLFFVACWLLRSVFNGRGSQVFLLFALLHGAGGVMIAVFHSGGGAGGVTLHQAGAVLAIGSGNVCLLTAGWIKRHSPGWRGYSLCSLMLGTLGLISMAAIPFTPFPVGIIERLSVYPITCWQIGTGIRIALMKNQY